MTEQRSIYNSGKRKTNIPDFGNKSPSQWLRNVMYRYWEQNAANIWPDFEQFYRQQISMIGKKYKDLLEG